MRWLFLLVSFLIQFLGASQVHQINSKTVQVSLAKGTQYFPTRNYSLNVNDIKDSDWEPSPNGSMFGISGNHIWVKHEILNTEDYSVSKYLYIPNHYTHFIDVYHLYSDSLLVKKEGGTNRSYNAKEKPSRGYSFLFHFPKGKSELIIHLEHLNMPLRADAFILSEKKLDETILYNQNAISIWRGLFYFTIIISFVMMLYLKNKAFRYYFIQHLGAAIWVGMEMGDFFYFFDSDPYNIINDIRYLGFAMLIIAFPLFLNEITPIKKNNPRMWRLMMYSFYILPILILLAIIPPIKNSDALFYIEHYCTLLSLFVFLLQVYFLVVCVLKKEKNSVLLLILYGVYLSVVMSNIILPQLGYGENELIIYRTTIYSSILESMMFLFMVARETLSVYQDRNTLLLKQKTHQLEIIKAIIDGQEQERNKLGAELHDMVGANISIIRQNVDKSDSKLMKLIDKTVDSVRSLSHGLLTPKLGEDLFVDEIKDLCLLASTDKTKVHYYFHNWKTIEDKEVSGHLYRIVQEMLQNATKHSSATEVYIQFIERDGHFSVTYEDNGVGMDLEKERRNGRGFSNIENRVSLIGGTFTIDSTVGKGCSMMIEFTQ